jgi:hypothetical protein
MPQPGDWIMALLFCYVFFKRWSVQGTVSKAVLSALKHFVILVVIISLLWVPFIDQSRETGVPSYFHPLFYIYNFLAFSISIILAQRFGNKFLLFTAYSIGASLIFQALLSGFTGATASRNALFFNNPNQLGYYALLAGSLMIYMVRSVKINSLFQIVAYFAFLYLTLLSASKAALAGAIILVVLAIFNQGFLSLKQFMVLLISILVGYYFINKDGLGVNLFTYAFERFETIGASADDSMEGRGYDRILNEPYYLLFGAGEGGYYRFNTLLKASEIHSSFGTIIFSYGILGLILFFRFLFKVLKGSSLFELLYFVPIFAYSITHQGLRDTLFWVFLGVVFILNQKKIFLTLSRLKAPRKRNRPGIQFRSLKPPPCHVENMQLKGSFERP